ncbi:MAG TPA: GDYXXLXY domain-containing protein [Spirochaetota bacterium]|nr:GDYXXLXY domain-containing protein [Spirochaetota bacterium]
MKKVIYIVLFICLAIFQLVVISVMVYKGVKDGQRLSYKCSLYDPYDPIKGRYLRLSFSSSTLNLYLFSEYIYDQSSDFDKYKNNEVYVVYNTGKDTQNPYLITTNKPNNDNIFIKAKINYINEENKTIVLEYPFDRYYIQEDFAIEAENLLRDSANNIDYNPTLVVNIDDEGNSRITNLLIKNTPIEEYISKKIKTKK